MLWRIQPADEGTDKVPLCANFACCWCCDSNFNNAVDIVGVQQCHLVASGAATDAYRSGAIYDPNGISGGSVDIQPGLASVGDVIL